MSLLSVSRLFGAATRLVVAIAAVTAVSSSISGRSWVHAGIGIGALIVLLTLTSVLGAGEGEQRLRTPRTRSVPKRFPSSMMVREPRASPDRERRQEPEVLEPTRAENDCLQAMKGQTQGVADALAVLRDLLRDPRLLSEEWLIKTTGQLAIVKVTFDEALDLDPPPSLEQVYTEYAAALFTFSLAADLIARGVDSRDSTLVEEAGTRVEMGVERLRQATERVAEYQLSRSRNGVGVD